MCLGRREEWGMGTHVFKSCISCRNWDSRPFQFSLRFTFSRASSLILLTSFSITLQSLKCWALSSWHLFNMTTAFLKTWHYKKEKKCKKSAFNHSSEGDQGGRSRKRWKTYLMNIFGCQPILNRRQQHLELLIVHLTPPKDKLIQKINLFRFVWLWSIDVEFLDLIRDKMFPA